MSREILDDLDWENEEPEENPQEQKTLIDSEVMMLKTFNTEDEAQICAATLRSAGVDAHVVASMTGQMTPFAYGNVRLFIAESQMEEALAILKQNEAENQVYENPKLSAGRILMIIIAVLFCFGLITGLVQLFLQQM